MAALDHVRMLLDDQCPACAGELDGLQVGGGERGSATRWRHDQAFPIRGAGWRRPPQARQIGLIHTPEQVNGAMKLEGAPGLLPKGSLAGWGLLT